MERHDLGFRRVPSLMSARSWALALLVSLSGLGCAASAPDLPPNFSTPEVAIDDTTPTDVLVAELAAGRGTPQTVAALRARGPSVMAPLLSALGKADPARVEGLRRSIDEIAQQRDADASGLYWFTDIERAKAEARATGRPILSLRLLGRLTDDLSCANSRFFRVALYANGEVSKVLRDEFVLHWSTEREAPVVTIDFRDGRKIQRTITGNSIHYVLDAEGRPLDAVPGLYGPKAFLAALTESSSIAAATRGLDASDAKDAVARHHQDRTAALARRWVDEVGRVGLVGLQPPEPVAVPAAFPGPPPASIAMPVAMPKAAVEMPILAATQPQLPATIEAVPEEAWRKLAAATKRDGLDARSLALLARKRPMVWTDPSGPRLATDAERAQLVESFEELMTLDALKNELRLRWRIHNWLALAPEVSLRDLNARVYSELFLTPANDPWLGLVPPRAFTGIEGDGLLTR